MQKNDMFIYNQGFGLVTEENEAILFVMHDMSFDTARKGEIPASAVQVDHVPNQPGFLQTVKMVSQLFGLEPVIAGDKSIYELMDLL